MFTNLQSKIRYLKVKTIHSNQLLDEGREICLQMLTSFKRRDGGNLIMAVKQKRVRYLSSRFVFVC